METISYICIESGEALGKHIKDESEEWLWIEAISKWKMPKKIISNTTGWTLDEIQNK